ncbi:MAG: SIMPL domain-containing protein, partial [Alphaproteobacteria bacterium]
MLIALLVAGLTTAFMVWSPAAAAQDGAVVTAPDPVLRVSGSGVVVAVPDMARFEAGVVVQARTAGQALTANGQALNAALEQFAGLGIARRDIRSTQISLS